MMDNLLNNESSGSAVFTIASSPALTTGLSTGSQLMLSINNGFSSSGRMPLSSRDIVASPRKNKQNTDKSRHRLSLFDERLLRSIFDGKSDEPLILTPTVTSFTNSPSTSSHILQDKENLSASGKLSTNDRHDNDENIPTAKNNQLCNLAVTHSQTTATDVDDKTEASEEVIDLDFTPPSERNSTNLTKNMCNNYITPKSNPYWNRLQCDFNSPSAALRRRAANALRSPGEKYYNFDVPHEEQDIITAEERRIPIPKTIQDVMRNVIVYVEYRTNEDNRSAGIKTIMSDLGATVNETFLKNTTHVIFKDGLLKTYNRAKLLNIPIVSLLWIEACRQNLRLVDPKKFPISDIERYENPELYKRMRRPKSMQPGAETKIKIKPTKPKNSNGNLQPTTSTSTSTSSNSSIRVPRLPKDKLKNILSEFHSELVGLTKSSNLTDCFSPNSKLREIITENLKNDTKNTKNTAITTNNTSNNNRDNLLSSETTSEELATPIVNSNRRITRRYSMQMSSTCDESSNDANDTFESSSVKKRFNKTKISKRHTIFSTKTFDESTIGDDNEANVVAEAINSTTPVENSISKNITNIQNQSMNLTNVNTIETSNVTTIPHSRPSITSTLTPNPTTTQTATKLHHSNRYNSRSARKTLFTPSIAETIIEEDNLITNNSAIVNVNVTASVKATITKTPKEKNYRRRTLFTPESSLNDMNISRDITNNNLASTFTTTVKPDSTRRKTMFTPKPMEETICKNYNTNLLKQSLNLSARKSMTAGTSSTIFTPKSTVVQSIISTSNQSSIVDTPNTHTNNGKSNRRRTLFTPNSFLEINKNKELETRSQLSHSFNLDAGNDSANIICSTPAINNNINTIKDRLKEINIHTNKATTIESSTILPTSSMIKTKTPLSNLNQFMQQPTPKSPINTIFNEYQNTITFNSARLPKSDKRKTIFDISMEIIDQRLKNINSNVRNRSASESDLINTIDLLDVSNSLNTDNNNNSNSKTLITKSAPLLINDEINKIDTPSLTQCDSNHVLSTVVTDKSTIENGINNLIKNPPKQQIIKKRRLFAQPTFIDDINVIGNNVDKNVPSTVSGNTIKRKTDVNINMRKSTSSSTTLKRCRDGNDVADALDNNLKKKFKFTISDNDKTGKFSQKSIIPTRINKTNNLAINDIAKRNSSKDFKKMSLSTKTKLLKNAKLHSQQQYQSGAQPAPPPPPTMVFTNMHKPQINFINETVKKLGKFAVDEIVTNNTTHVITFESRRTINLLRGLIRGLWILNYNWIIDSEKAGKWIAEESYEIRGFSNAVSMCRADRQAFGKTFRNDIFSELGPIYVSTKCKCPNLKELIRLSYGNVTHNRIEAKYIIAEKVKSSTDRLDRHVVYLHPNWILDSIQFGRLKETIKYIIRDNNCN